MEEIYLTSKDISSSYEMYYGYESHIYKFDSDTVMKIFRTDDEDVLKNKRQKIILLSDLDVDFIPIKLIYIDGIFKGYVYRNLADYSPINCLIQKKKEKYEILFKIYAKLEQLHKYGIIYGDLHQDNILYNGHDIVICDLDNSYINGLGFDTTNNHISRYIDFVKTIDNRLDNFAMNLLTVYYIQNISYAYIYDYLITEGRLKRPLNSKKNNEIIQEMICLKPDYSGELFIDNPRKKLTLK